MCWSPSWLPEPGLYLYLFLMDWDLVPWWFCRGPGDSWHLQSLLWQATMVEGRITWCDHHDANIWCKHMMHYVKNVMFLFFSFDVWVLWILMQLLTSTSSKQCLGIFLPAVNHLSPHQDWVEGRRPTWRWTLTSLFLPSDSETQLLEVQPQNTFFVSMPSRPLQVVKTTSWGKARASIQQPHSGFKKD